MPKLTLSATSATVELAKSLAAEQNTSVSALFERFVHVVAAQGRRPGTVAPLTRRVSGLQGGHRHMVWTAVTETTCGRPFA